MEHCEEPAGPTHLVFTQIHRVPSPSKVSSNLRDLEEAPTGLCRALGLGELHSNHCQSQSGRIDDGVLPPGGHQCYSALLQG